VSIEDKPNLTTTNPATGTTGTVRTGGAGSRSLDDLPKDELESLAREYGLDPHESKTRVHLVAEIQRRRALISSMDRNAMLEVLTWGGRNLPASATKEQLASEIARITSMRFSGLSKNGLVVLAGMRGVSLKGDEDDAGIIKKLKKNEGLFARLNRKRRAWVGSIVSGMLGEDSNHSDGQFAAPQSGAVKTQTTFTPVRNASIKDEIEDQGLFGGLANRVRKSADSYLNQKLDEIEARIDRKLDEIDRRLGDWRDKEVANRIRILKITLWASVIVAGLSLVYSYVVVYLKPPPSVPNAQSTTQLVRPQ
jgi:hypothetical protein